MTTTQRYNPVEQQFPDGYDRDGESAIAEQLRPYYRRSPQLDANRVTALRATRREPFAMRDELWAPGAGIPPGIDPRPGAGRAALELCAHYAALADADAERRAEAAEAQAAAEAAARTCACCGTVDRSTRPRSGPPDLEAVVFGGWRLCNSCARLIRRAWLARLDADADLLALEPTPAGPRGEAAEAWLRAALGEDGSR